VGRTLRGALDEGIVVSAPFLWLILTGRLPVAASLLLPSIPAFRLVRGCSQRAQDSKVPM
jgi:hypothetical protein